MVSLPMALAPVSLAPEQLPDKPSFTRRIEKVPVGVVLAIALVGGLVPLKVRELQQNRERVLSLGAIFSGGLFLCAGFSHMLGEALEGFQQHDLPTEVRSLCHIISFPTLQSRICCVFCIESIASSSVTA